jgi:hypothetical protein
MLPESSRVFWKTRPSKGALQLIVQSHLVLTGSRLPYILFREKTSRHHINHSQYRMGYQALPPNLGLVVLLNSKICLLSG